MIAYGLPAAWGTTPLLLPLFFRSPALAGMLSRCCERGCLRQSRGGSGWSCRGTARSRLGLGTAQSASAPTTFRRHAWDRGHGQEGGPGAMDVS